MCTDSNIMSKIKANKWSWNKRHRYHCVIHHLVGHFCCRFRSIWVIKRGSCSCCSQWLKSQGRGQQGRRSWLNRIARQDTINQDTLGWIGVEVVIMFVWCLISCFSKEVDAGLSRLNLIQIIIIPCPNSNDDHQFLR